MFLHTDKHGVKPTICKPMACRNPRLIRTCCAALAMLLLACASLAPRSAEAQTSPPARQYLQAGLGVIPGIGIQGGGIAPRGIYTVEGILYVDFTPPFAGGEGSVLVSGGIGGAIRIFDILRTLGSPGYRTRDLDVGVRFGPSLFFAIGESSRSENPFGLFIDPFVRVTTTLGGSRLFFAEAGFQRPLLRVGVLFDL